MGDFNARTSSINDFSSLVTDKGMGYFEISCSNIDITINRNRPNVIHFFKSYNLLISNGCITPESSST